MSGGYSYITLSGGPDEPVQAGVSLRLDDRARIAVLHAESGRPFLDVAYGDVSVSISPMMDQATAEDARIARRLADQAAAYAAEVEQLSAAVATTPDCDGATGDDAAGVPAA